MEPCKILWANSLGSKHTSHNTTFWKCPYSVGDPEESKYEIQD